MKLLLEVISGPHAGARFEFDRHETFLAGRDCTAHLALTLDHHFSRHHFLLEFSPPHCSLRDLDSRNGTKVNGLPVKQVSLSDGDIISGGKTKLRVTMIAEGKSLRLCQSCAQHSLVETVGLQQADESTDAYLCPGCTAQLDSQPQAVPGYEVIRQLGRGGMGVVYLARQLATGTIVAVKTILPECAAGESAVQLFLREASILSQLDHRRIVRFMEVGTSRGQFFLVMEYVPTIDLSGSLQERTSARRTQIACGIGCQILEALRYAHGRGFVHRDVKPGNVLLTRSEQRLRSKLADFGLAKNFENGGFSGITRRGDLRGSLPYMPPEQITDCRQSQPSNDIYSTGATLYRLLSNQLPHDYPETADPYGVVLDHPVVPLLDRCPNLPSGLAAVIHKALARDPAQRFASAHEMHRNLLPYAKGTAVT